ncbi:MAG: YaaC family protein [Dictyoglomaceae bacterium]|nr:YaaC family protein [Dictyoglomaceae bacterium]
MRIFKKIFRNSPYKIFGELEENLLNLLNEEEQHFLHYTLKQAKLSFEAKKRVDLYLSPLLLFYGIVALAKITIFLKTHEIPREVLHGLTVRVAGEKSMNWSKEYDPGKETILIKEKGLFPTFFKCISSFQIPEGEKFTLEELFLFLNMNTSLPPLAVHYLILFLLSMLSRYEPQKWGWTIDRSNLSKKIKRYLEESDLKIIQLWRENIKL